MSRTIKLRVSGIPGWWRMVRENFMRKVLDVFHVQEGEVLPRGIRYIYYTLFPRILMKVWIGPWLTGLNWSMDRAALMVNGKPISIMFLEMLARRSPADGKAFLHQTYSPDVPENMVYIVEHVHSLPEGYEPKTIRY